jgi:hypothetical protein
MIQAALDRATTIRVISDGRDPLQRRWPARTVASVRLAIAGVAARAGRWYGCATGRAAVERRASAKTVARRPAATFEETAYFFCSLACAAEFARHPERFAREQS